MEEQETSPEKELNETETTKIPDTELKKMIKRILKDFRGRMDMSENLKRE